MRQKLINKYVVFDDNQYWTKHYFYKVDIPNFWCQRCNQTKIKIKAVQVGEHYRTDVEYVCEECYLNRLNWLKKYVFEKQLSFF